MKKYLFILFCFSFVCALNAQNDSIPRTNLFYPEVNENKIIESKWKYTYALHVESNTRVHQAGNDYDYFLYFKYDYTYRQYLNGSTSRGNWKLTGNDLDYSFKHIKGFILAEVTNERLVLEFTQPNSKGAYQYHFVRVSSKDAPFERPAFQLPDVEVESKLAIALQKRRNTKKDKKRNRRKNKKYVPLAERPTYINIELIGGGYYGGIDPVLKDIIQIKSSGRLIKEFHSVQRGRVVNKNDIPRDELEEFAKFIDSKGFFEMERMYDCEDEVCFKRKRQKPIPIPLRLSVAYGKKKKVITIAVWGKERNNIQYIDYPKELDFIIQSIQKMAARSI